MTALLATLPLQVVCQLLVSGHPGITENGTLVGGEIPRRTSSVDLPEGYVPFFEDQAAYKIHEELATWNEARERCMSEGAYLAVADSREKITNIKSISNQSDSWLHVGIYNSANSDQWIRVDNGLPVESVPWAYNDSNRTGSCAGISLFNDGLVDYFCSGKKEYFVCEIPIPADNGEGDSTDQVEIVAVNTKNSPVTIPEGYVAFPEDHAAYKIYKEYALWDEARDKCISEGARLPITDSVDKIKHINSLKDNWSNQWLHVGIRKSETIGQWVGIDTDLPPSSIPWAKDQPDDLGDCVGISLVGDELVNYSCDRQYEFIVCEIPI